MRKFIVIALSVGALSGKIFKSGDIVNEDAWEPGRADELIEGQFIEEYTGKENEEPDAGLEVQPPLPDVQLEDQATNESELRLPETKPDTKKAVSKK